MPGGTRSYEMGRRLVSFGHEVHMITSQRQDTGGNNKWLETTEDGIHVHWLPVPYTNHMGYGERIKAFFKFALTAGPKAAGLDCDIVFASSTPLTIAIPAVYASKTKKIPMVFEVRDLWPELPIVTGALKNPATIAAANWLERFAYNNSSHVVALSPGMREGVARTGYPQEKITVIPNGCDMALFDVDPEQGQELRKQFDWLGQRPLIIYTGTLGPVNGLEFLARLAASTWRIDPEIRFLVIGSGKDELKVRQTAAQLGVLDRNFFMMPSLPKREIPGWLAAADIATSFLVDIKTVWTNSANKFFDALAAGRPIAINYNGWLAKTIRDSGAGLVLDAEDIESSAQRISKAVRDRNWLADTGVIARKLAKEQFERDKLARQLEGVLREAVYAQLENESQTLSVD